MREMIEMKEMIMTKAKIRKWRMTKIKIIIFIKERIKEKEIILLKKKKDLNPKNIRYKFTVGQRKLKFFNKGGKILGGVAGAVGGALKVASLGMPFIAP